MGQLIWNPLQVGSTDCKIVVDALRGISGYPCKVMTIFEAIKKILIVANILKEFDF